MTRFALCSAAAIVLTSASARAQFAEPPPDQEEPALAVDDDEQEPDADRGRDPYNHDDPVVVGPRSSLRIFTGPALRVSNDAAEGGLFVALDIGARAAGARLSGTWVHAGSPGGASQYAGEIWIDFRDEDRIHPILAAGAGVARLDGIDQATGEPQATTVGIGLLRGSLHYRLPVRGVDARAGLDVIGSVPAFGAAAEETSPWLTVSASVGVGF